MRYGLNQQSDVRYSLRHLPKAGPWLLQYWRHSSPKGLAAATRAMLPLIERCVSEHLALARPANMLQLIADGGWLEAFNDPQAFDFAQRAAADLRDYQLNYRVLDRAELLALEPGLHPEVVGGLHWLDPKTVSDPGGLTRGYAELFKQRGGQFVIGDALSLTQVEGGWQVHSELGPITAQEVVVALGPQASGIFEPLGYRIPLAIKRGYHMHYAALPGTRLQHPILDPVGGYVLAPMVGGIRLTTGIEFADCDDPINEIQLRRCEALARNFYPLGERLDAEPWLGRRPCLPDMCPVIGPAPPPWPVVQLRPRPPRPDPGPGERPTASADGHRRNALHRPHPLPRRALQLTDGEPPCRPRPPRFPPPSKRPFTPPSTRVKW
ncbi:hypothetical protein PBOI14_27930 [Pseudomonas sp. Boi14]|nr:hypothetical protein PBOI14_27930 [Pseudomonas sp. Boi14]